MLPLSIALSIALTQAPALVPTAQQQTPPPAAQPSPVVQFFTGWHGLANLNIAYLSGNTNSFTINFNAGANKKFGAWGVGLKLWTSYGFATVNTYATSAPTVPIPTTSTVALLGGFNIRGERDFTKIVGMFLSFNEDFDHVKNIEARHMFDLGVALNFLNIQPEKDWRKLYLRVDIGLRGGYESDFQYYPTPKNIGGYGMLAQRTALAIYWSPVKTVRLSNELEVIPYLLPVNTQTLNIPAGRVLVNNLFKLSADITKYLAVTTSLLVSYDSHPPKALGGVDRVNTDLILLAGIEAKF